MRARPLVLLAVAWLGAIPASGAEAPPPGASPDANEIGRPITALSDSEVRGLLAGEGLGFAKVAELNRYPGPRHVLDLAGDLDLTPDQRRRVAALYDSMHASAAAVGREIVALEQTLERSFAGGSASEDAVRELTSRIADLYGRLRAVHLTAHVATRAALTPGQVAHYHRLRGYAPAASAGSHEHGQTPSHSR